MRFTPYAWAKLVFLRDRGESEIGAFGITPPDDPLRVTDVVTVKQRCSSVTVAFDDGAVADFFEAMAEAGRRPENFARIWVHSHPGDSPEPSVVDEETFARVFGRCEWAVMFIVARNGATYARLAFGVGPGGEIEVPVAVDFHAPFPAADPTAWAEEYRQNVIAQRGIAAAAPMSLFGPHAPDGIEWIDAPLDAEIEPAVEWEFVDA